MTSEPAVAEWDPDLDWATCDRGYAFTGGVARSAAGELIVARVAAVGGSPAPVLCGGSGRWQCTCGFVSDMGCLSRSGTPRVWMALTSWIGDPDAARVTQERCERHWVAGARLCPGSVPALSRQCAVWKGCACCLAGSAPVPLLGSGHRHVPSLPYAYGMAMGAHGFGSETACAAVGCRCRRSKRVSLPRLWLVENRDDVLLADVAMSTNPVL
jgi:hypothetical protein